jgi:hypothetical protein
VLHGACMEGAWGRMAPPTQLLKLLPLLVTVLVTGPLRAAGMGDAGAPSRELHDEKEAISPRPRAQSACDAGLLAIPNAESIIID